MYNPDVQPRVGYGGEVGITVGFDLDMTLIDPRPGMIAVMRVLGEQSGLVLDGEYFAAHLGPPLEQGLAACEAGGRTVVVTGKYGPNAALHVEALGFEVDVLVGELWATGKAQTLIDNNAVAYVGDHVGDVQGALAARAVPVGVVTGPCGREELLEAGAAVVFDSLDEFPAWLAATSGELRERARSGPAPAPAG
jgi:phosphoglycolate phosphatase